MEYALIYVITAIIAGAMTGAVVTTWSLKLQILRLETTVEGLQERQASTSGRELARTRWSKRDAEQEVLLRQLRANKGQGFPGQPEPAQFDYFAGH